MNIRKLFKPGSVTHSFPSAIPLVAASPGPGPRSGVQRIGTLQPLAEQRTHSVQSKSSLKSTPPLYKAPLAGLEKKKPAVPSSGLPTPPIGSLEPDLLLDLSDSEILAPLGPRDAVASQLIEDPKLLSLVLQDSFLGGPSSL